MSIGILGTPTTISSGSTYTVESGSNRVVLFAARSKATPSVSLSSLTWNGVAGTIVVQRRDSAVGDRDSVAWVMFKEANVQSGAQTVAATWSASPGGADIVCTTVGDVDQTTTTRTSGSADGNGTTLSVALTVTVGDLCLGALATRGPGTPFTLANSFTKYAEVADNGDGGSFCNGYKTAVSTTETFQISTADDCVAAALALIPFSGGGGGSSSFLTLLGVG